MEAVRIELRRLLRGYARAVGGARAARWHVGILVAAIVLAFVHRAIRAVPFFEHLAGRWIPALLAAVVLYFLGYLLRPLAGLLVRPPEDAFARHLDDRFAWHDSTETALTLTDFETQRPVPAFLAAQATGRLRGVEPRQLARSKRPGRWLRRVLAFLFAAVLLLPGVSGLWGDTGGTVRNRPGGGPRPMKADFWLQTFVENPLGVEPLGVEPQEGLDQDAKQGKDAKEEEREEKRINRRGAKGAEEEKKERKKKTDHRGTEDTGEDKQREGKKREEEKAGTRGSAK